MGCINSTQNVPSRNVQTAHIVPDSLILAIPPETKASLLDSVNIESLPIDTHDGLVCECKLIDVYDGDTCTIVFVGKYGVIEKRKFRFWGYNAKEMKQPKKLAESERQRNKALAIEAKEFLIKIIGQDKHYVIFADETKANNYGRLLGRVLLSSGEFKGRYVDELMIERKLAQPYDGEHRNNDETW